MANREHNTFAKQFIQNSIEKVANGTATEVDRSNVINGAVLEILEDISNNMTPKTNGLRGKVQRQAVPVVGGAGAFVVIIEVVRVLSG